MVETLAFFRDAEFAQRRFERLGNLFETSCSAQRPCGATARRSPIWWIGDRMRRFSFSVIAAVVLGLEGGDGDAVALRRW